MINIQLVVGRKVHRRDNDDTEAPEPDQTQIPSHPGIKYSARGIPHSDIQNILDRGNPIKLININGNLWKWGCPKATIGHDLHVAPYTSSNTFLQKK